MHKILIQALSYVASYIMVKAWKKFDGPKKSSQQ